MILPDQFRDRKPACLRRAARNFQECSNLFRVALCLAAAFAACPALDAADQWAASQRGVRCPHMSSTGACLHTGCSGRQSPSIAYWPCGAGCCAITPPRKCAVCACCCSFRPARPHRAPVFRARPLRARCDLAGHGHRGRRHRRHAVCSKRPPGAGLPAAIKKKKMKHCPSRKIPFP